MLRSMLYTHEGRVEVNVPVDRFREVLANPNNLLWVDIEGPEDAEIEVLLDVFELHSLTVEDCIMPNVRPKLEDFDRYLFVIMQGLARDPESGELRALELDVCLGGNFLVSVRTESIPSLDQDWVRAEKKSPIISRGADFLFYSIADSLFDSYFPFLEEVDSKVDALEHKLLSNGGTEPLRQLFRVYNELMILRRTLRPHREIISRIYRRDDHVLINPANRAYFRDISDHLLRMSDLAEQGREITMLLLDTHATVASHRLNEVMRTMTALATLVTPMIVVTGIYGMNFSEHPWLPTWIFHVLSLLFVGSIPVMWYFFRKNRWL
jgi:magnesium transporter